MRAPAATRITPFAPTATASGCCGTESHWDPTQKAASAINPFLAIVHQGYGIGSSLQASHRPRLAMNAKPTTVLIAAAKTPYRGTSQRFNPMFKHAAGPV